MSFRACALVLAFVAFASASPQLRQGFDTNGLPTTFVDNPDKAPAPHVATPLVTKDGTGCGDTDDASSLCNQLASSGACSAMSELMGMNCATACGACEIDGMCAIDDDEHISYLAATFTGETISTCEEAIALNERFFGTGTGCGGPYASFLEQDCPCACDSYGEDGCDGVLVGCTSTPPGFGCDRVVDLTISGMPARGFDLRCDTTSNIGFIGVAEAAGGNVDSFSCTGTSSITVTDADETLHAVVGNEFGTSGGVGNGCPGNDCSAHPVALLGLPGGDGVDTMDEVCRLLAGTGISSWTHPSTEVCQAATFIDGAWTHVGSSPNILKTFTCQAP